MKNQWFISIKKNNGDIFDISDLQHNYPPEGKYWADPFLYQHNGIDYIFYELYDYEKGVIAYSVINDDMTFTEPTIVLERPYHLSYPHLFEDNGELYMIPETGSVNCIELYKCISFPNEWKFEKQLLNNVNTADNNIFVQDNRYWMFTTTQPSLKHQLLVLTSESLHGPWDIVINQHVEHSRSAGKIFRYDDKLYRSVQNGKGGYGTGIHFKSTILDLENSIYDENIEHSIEAMWHPEIFGTHHFDFNDKYIVIDGKRKVQ
tara:strand:+ start:252 stop:1034 length:783 start_codon:yes stop_codon:yes gene_type:complete